MPAEIGTVAPFASIAPMPPAGADPLDRVAEYIGGHHRRPSSLTAGQRRAVALYLLAADEWRDGGAVGPAPVPPRCLLDRPPLPPTWWRGRWQPVALGALVAIAVTACGSHEIDDERLIRPAPACTDVGADGGPDGGCE